MAQQPPSIPRPLVRTNQWIIVLSVAATWLTGQFWILLIPLLSGLSGLFFQFNPVMKLAKLFLRKPASSYIPEDRDQQKFNQTIAVSCLSLAFISYLLNWHVAAIIFTAIVGLAAFIAILGFCIGCFIHFHLSQYLQRRRSHV
ncbi:DUF4395 domain-containing protein [Sporolactobacillus sp. CQH2019]|uniref:DUF4395 domain-containing protein n=1 Tax=Sporolactobacillus sp. CQH2019 TaxID=3023512 RepID=UPI0023678CCD|nr:DUF4395 domain-containing protein [Sporolactobacillus sp. CQH2019]MDD9149567.1 DUF4395 domain-containing protein [Sporolactobacillus sp. CQH2019]